MKLVLLDTAALASNDLSLDVFQQFGEVDCYDRTPPELAAEPIGTAEIAFTNKSLISNQVLDACPNLTYIRVFATGYNVIEDIHKTPAQRGITICNVPEYSTAAVAQNAFAHILSFYNKIDEHQPIRPSRRLAKLQRFFLLFSNLRTAWKNIRNYWLWLHWTANGSNCNCIWDEGIGIYQNTKIRIRTTGNPFYQFR